MESKSKRKRRGLSKKRSSPLVDLTNNISPVKRRKKVGKELKSKKKNAIDLSSNDGANSINDCEDSDGKSVSRKSMPRAKYIHYLPENDLSRGIKISEHIKLDGVFISTIKKRRSKTKENIEFFVNLGACYVFAQTAGGAAVCVNQKGYVITNAHCLDDGKDEETVRDKLGKKRVLVSGLGEIVSTTCVAVENTMDIVLLKIVKVYSHEKLTWVTPNNQFPEISLHSGFPYEVEGTDYSERVNIPQSSHIPYNADIMCIGMFGMYKDLPQFEGHCGKYLGVLDEGANLHDNASDLGQLMHDVGTFWGTSGAPLVLPSGELIGLHNSYSPDTYMRHGVHLHTVKRFLKKYKLLMT